MAEQVGPNNQSRNASGASDRQTPDVVNTTVNANRNAEDVIDNIYYESMDEPASNQNSTFNASQNSDIVQCTQNLYYDPSY